MKGLGVFSPCASTSRCLLVASELGESGRTGSSLSSESEDISLNLLKFKVVEHVLPSSNPFASQFDVQDSFLAGNNATLDGYISSCITSSIGEFSTVHKTSLDVHNAKLTSVNWVDVGSDFGTIVLGTSVGDLKLLDGHAFLNDCESVLISSTNICTTPINCLNFNSKTSMLGVASVDGHISVCDLNDLKNIRVIDTSSGKWKVGLVTSLSWNRRLGHILATSGSSVTLNDSSGLVVWDLKTKKPASSFRDPSGRNNPTAIDWVPTQPTQLVVGYGDDNSPALQLWDLRNSSSPVKEIKGHTRGLSDLKFSPHDSSLLLTSGKDDFTKCWTMDSANGSFNLLSNIQTEALSHHTNVDWHPHLPGLFLARGTDGGHSLYHILSGSVEGNYIPLWVRKQSGLVSGFAGSLTYWEDTGEVKCFTSNDKMSPEVCGLLDETVDLLSGLHDRTVFNNLCKEKISTAKDEFNKLTWNVLHSLYNDDVSSLSSLFGYKPRNFASDVKSTLASGASASFSSNSGSVVNETLEAEDFFDSLSKRNTVLEEPVKTPNEGDKDVLSWGDGEFREYLVVGRFEEAAELCMRSGKMVEAVLLSYVGGPEVSFRITREIVNRSDDPLLRTIFLIMQGDVISLINKSQLDDWKETLSCLCTYSNTLPNFKDLCNLLGDRLAGSKTHLVSASVCYICGGNFNGVTNIWNKLGSDKTGIHKLVDDLIRTAALSISVNRGRFGDEFGKSIAHLAETFVDCGHLDRALKCLSLPGVPDSLHISQLRNCIQACLTTTSHIPVSPATAQHIPSFTPAQVPTTSNTPVVSTTSHHVQASTTPSHVPPVPTNLGTTIPPYNPQVSTFKPAPILPTSSTAPGVVAASVNPGMPIPWPLPTPTQQLGSKTKSTEESNRLVIESTTPATTTGDMMMPNDLNLVTNTLKTLVENGGNTRSAEDNRRNVSELLNLLSKGTLNNDANNLLVNMCRAINAGDKVNANIALSSITNKLWNNNNKNWIVCLKRIVPK